MAQHRVKYRWLSQDGYIHLGLDDGRIVAEHRHVWERANGPIPEGYQIHHLDSDRTNNKLRNLEALLPGDHKRAHCGHWKDVGGRWWKRCRVCCRALPEDDYPTKRYVDGVRKTRGNCKACERDRSRARKGYAGTRYAEGSRGGYFLGPRA
ncbi:MAG: HNH endonuclease signature motif containing protein [Roseovarius indicus]